MNAGACRVRVPLDGDSYSVHIGAGILADVARLLPLDRFTRVGILTDENVAGPWLTPISDGLRAACGERPPTLVLPPGEAAKTVESVRVVWRWLAAAGFDRDSLLLDLGGGVVGDTGGFAASTFMRGIRFAQLPTTLLAQVDASVGGKVGVDEAGAKNLVGCFAQPVAVVADVETLRTLPGREARAGLAEMVKHGAIRDRDHFDALTPELCDGALGEAASATRGRDHERRLADLIPHIARSVEIKARVVAADVRERGERRLLNFGHTAGHAVEAWALALGVPLLHGEAVAIGMAAAARISVEVGALPGHEGALLDERLRDLRLPTQLPEGSGDDAIARIAEYLALDKKARAGRLRWTLLEGIGRGRVDAEVPEAVVVKALRSLLPGACA